MKKKSAKPRVKREPLPQAWPEDIEHITPTLAWGTVYWMVGPTKYRNEVKDPPCAGQAHVFVLPQGENKVRLFCPYTFYGHTVTSSSSEYLSLLPSTGFFDPHWAAKAMKANWEAFERYGFQRDYDTAARVFRELGLEVPLKQVVEKELPPGVEQKRKGKEAAASLIKPVPKDGRRGQVLAWFMESLEPRSIREAMAEFNTTRSNILTVLYQLNKDHGFGYVLVGDAAEIELPAKGTKKLYC